MPEGVDNLLSSPVLLVPELKAILITHNNCAVYIYLIRSIRQFVTQILNCLPYSTLHLDAQSMSDWKKQNLFCRRLYFFFYKIDFWWRLGEGEEHCNHGQRHPSSFTHDSVLLYVKKKNEAAFYSSIQWKRNISLLFTWLEGKARTTSCSGNWNIEVQISKYDCWYWYGKL